MSECLTYDDERLHQLYQEERSKLSPVPDADNDFIALENAIKRRFKEINESEENNV